MRKPFSALHLLLAALFVITATASAFGQSNKGSIVGTVRDPKEALVANAKVKVKSVKTGEVRETDTSDEGTFTVTNLEPGDYNVTIEAPGFQPVIFKALHVETNARLPLDVRFGELRRRTSTVTITASSAPLVESETSVRGDLITGRQVTDLPIPQRNFTLLAACLRALPVQTSVCSVAAVTSFPVVVDRTTPSRLASANPVARFSLSTARARRTTTSVWTVLTTTSRSLVRSRSIRNRMQSRSSRLNRVCPRRSPAAPVVVLFQRPSSQAEMHVHGTVGEIYQGRFLSAAASRFDDPTSPDVPNYVTHNFYGTVGGPIFLPRFGEGTPAFYDGRNRSFFFFSLNGQRNSTPIFGGTGDPQAVPVPTARMRVGDFGELLRPGTSREFPLAGGGTVTAPIGTIFAPNGTPIPGNDLRNCPSCGGFSPFALNYVNAFPLPNLPGAGRNFVTNRKEGANVNSYDIRIDHRITDNNTLFGRYSKSDTARSRDNFFPLGTSPNGNDLPAGPSAGDEFGDSRGFTLGDTHVFSPTVVNDARFGYTRVDIGIFNTGVNGTGGFSPNISAQLGAPNINLGPNSSGIVLVGIVDELTGIDRATEFTGDGGPFYFLSNNFNFVDTVTLVKGNSTFKFGGDYRVRQNSNFDGGRNNGTKGNYQYGTTGSGFVSGNYNGIGPNDTGSSLANFLLGYQPGFVGRGDPGGPYLQSSKEIAFFVQDDWKVNPDLTLNLGLRYDVFTAPTERFDRQSNFDPVTQNDPDGGRECSGRTRPGQHGQEQFWPTHRFRLQRSQGRQHDGHPRWLWFALHD